MTMDISLASSALEGAGNDVHALTAAIEAAAFLDGIPGDGRQALRAARKRLRDAQREAAAQQAKMEATNAANRSPHTKASYDVAEFDSLVQQYDALKWRLVQKPGGAAVRADEYYQLYGLHKQAEEGNNIAERPMWAERGGLDFDGRCRWDAWTALKDMSLEKAKLGFVQLFYEFSPSALYQDTRGGDGGD